ncbi:MAG: hypothetical protein WB791_00620 [Waddliaceae bacterium]
MMIEITNKKIQVSLSDYPYHRDIAHRLLIAELTNFEVEVIQEILHSSLKISIFKLADTLSVAASTLLPALEKLKNTQLFHLDTDHIIVDKQMRKFYGFHMAKFDRNFRSDMEFLRKSLQQIPIHLLPDWYAIPRTSDDIFTSIIDKFFRTPQIYRQHLDDLRFDDFRLHEILNDVYRAPDFKVRTKTLLDKYSLSREMLEEYLLLLEFNLACCSSYEQCDGQWEEIITPFFEWRAYRRLLRDRIPNSIQHPLSIQRTHPQDFGFIQDMNILLTAVCNQPLSLRQEEGDGALSLQAIKSLFSSVYAQHPSDSYLHSLLEKLQQLHLAAAVDHYLCPCGMTDDWLKKPLEKQAFAMYKSTAAALYEGVDRNQRKIERCLADLSVDGWMYVEDFAKACTAPIGNHSPVMLKKTGKKWKYHLPAYTSEDVQTLHNYLFQDLFYAGIMATGVHENKPCFCLTRFGRMILNG